MSTAPLLGSPRGFVNVASYLGLMAEQRPHEMAVVLPTGRNHTGRASYSHLTFAQLDADSDRIARGLEVAGIGRGTRTVLMVKPSLDFFALTFALFKVGAVPVLIDPGMGIARLGSCLKEAEPEAFIGIPKAHIARILLGWAKRTLRTRIVVGRMRLPGCRYTLDQVRRLAGSESRYEMADTSREDVAAILFTSGSTGPAKGAVYTHGIFAAQVEVLRDHFEIQPGERDLGTFPLFALFGPALGMTVLVPEMDASRPGSADPTRLIEMIEDFGATNMFGSPAVLDLLGRYGAPRGIRLPSLRRVFSAGAPASIPVLERFQAMLAEDVPIHTPYGATESLPVASISSQEIFAETRKQTESGAGVCVGRPAGEMTVRIIEIRDEPIATWSDDLLLPSGEVGEIVVEGPVVTHAYLNRPDATHAAKIRRGDVVLHRMGDVGYFDESGRLWFCGRKAHRVESPARTLFTMQVEAVFNTLDTVRRTALVGVGKPGAAKPVLCVECEPGHTTPWPAIEAALRERARNFEHTRDIDTFLQHPGFPVDIRHNAKIFREKLAVWASERAHTT